MLQLFLALLSCQDYFSAALRLGCLICQLAWTRPGSPSVPFGSCFLRTHEPPWSESWTLEIELSAQRSEISRLHGRLRRLEAELQQGRNWLLFLGDKVSALEDKTQQLVVRIRALISIFKETLGEVVARLQIWF